MSKYYGLAWTILALGAAIFAGCQTNNAPDVPSTPTGPASGSVDVAYAIASSAEDADNDDVAIRFSWGDGDTSDWSDWQASGDSISMTHAWSDSGTYSIRAQAQDTKDAASTWSHRHDIAIGTQAANNGPPGTPATPIGDSTGSVDSSCTFASTSVDPDGDSIAIRFDWGDGKTSDWSDWVASGDTVTMSHAWSDTGSYSVTAQARDVMDSASAWSAGHSITISGGGGSGWARTYGGGDDDYGYSVRPTTDGDGYIIAGATKSYGVGDHDVYLVRTDADGDTLWTNDIGGAGADIGSSVQPTSDDGYIITGTTESYGNQRQIYLVKTFANGVRDWYVNFGSSGHDGGSSVWQTTDGGYIVTGYVYYLGTTSYDICLYKTDADGNEIWHKFIGGGADDYGWSVQQTEDGGYIVTGIMDGDVYLHKTDADGNETWHRTFGGASDDCGYSVQQTLPDHGYIIVGRTSSSGAGGRDVYLVKTDSGGNEIWDKTFGGAGDDCGNSVQRTVDGGYIIAGYTNSSGAGDYDVYLVRTDANGNKLWEKTFGGPLEDGGTSVCRDYDGFVVAGYTKSSGSGGADVYLIKTDSNGNVE